MRPRSIPQVSDYDTIDRGPYRTVAGGVPFTIFPQVEAFYLEDKDYYGNELNLISTGDGNLQWIVGLYQYHEQVNQNSGVRVPLQTQLATPRMASNDADRLRAAEPGSQPANRRRTPGCGCASRVRTDRLQLLADLEDHHRLALHRGQQGRGGVPDACAVRLPGRAFMRSIARSIDAIRSVAKWNATTGTAGLQWSPNGDTMAFAKYTRGYKSGGFNAGAFAPDRTGYTEPEYINSYELGLKQTLFGRLTANLSIFHYDYKDAQCPSTVRDPVSNINESRFFNLENAVSQGVELEALWAVTDALQLNLSYSYLDTEIQDKRCFIDGDDTGATAPDARPCGTRVPGQQIGQRIDGGRLPSSPGKQDRVQRQLHVADATGRTHALGHLDVSRRDVLLGVRARLQPRAVVRRDRRALAVERAGRPLHVDRFRAQRVR